MLSLAAALSGALLLQAAPAQDPVITNADATRLQELSLKMMYVTGSCHAVFPPEINETIEAQLDAYPDQEGAAVISAAYKAGKVSPEAASRTMDSCLAAMDAIGQELQAIVQRISPPQ